MNIEAQLRAELAKMGGEAERLARRREAIEVLLALLPDDAAGPIHNGANGGHVNGASSFVIKEGTQPERILAAARKFKKTFNALDIRRTTGDVIPSINSVLSLLTKGGHLERVSSGVYRAVSP